MRYHKSCYYICADDMQNENVCLSDIRMWVITNKLKINDSKTEFIVFKSPRLKCDLSGLSVDVGERFGSHIRPNSQL